MTEMQSDFEDWLKEFRGDNPAKMPVSLEYMAWQAWQKAWQASRAAIVVTLPETHNDWLDKQVVQHALQQEGIRYE